MPCVGMCGSGIIPPSAWTCPIKPHEVFLELVIDLVQDDKLEVKVVSRWLTFSMSSPCGAQEGDLLF